MRVKNARKMQTVQIFDNRFVETAKLVFSYNKIIGRFILFIFTITFLSKYIFCKNGVHANASEFLEQAHVRKDAVLKCFASLFLLLTNAIFQR
jgi:hypothetical protein